VTAALIPLPPPKRSRARTQQGTIEVANLVRMLDRLRRVFRYELVPRWARPKEKATQFMYTKEKEGVHFPVVFK